MLTLLDSSRGALIGCLIAIVSVVQPPPIDPSLRSDIQALNASMVAAFKRDPGSVATFYTDNALIVGGGRRSEGRAAIDEYWKQSTMFTDWSLEVLQAGGTADAPWQYGRSVLTGKSGQTMETFFLGLLRRQGSALKFQVDAYARARKTIGAEEAARVTDAWSKAVRGDETIMKTILKDPFAILSSSTPESAGPQLQGNAAIVDSVASTVGDRYVFPELAPKIAAHVRDKARQGAYEKLTGGELADALTRDLRTLNSDRHLYVQYQAGQSSMPVAGAVRLRPGGSAGELELIRRRNYFLNRAERLDGNIGYLEVRRFFSLADEAREAIAGAMAFLGQTDAIIIDVRVAPGGDAGMVDLIASYFFDRVVPTLASYSRSRNETIQRSTLESVPGRRRPNIPVYVLTSRDTGSAAEAFAFLMQQTGRATLIGDRTAGAGHLNAIFGIGGGYSVSVSVGRTYNPKTNQGWEGIGVQPEVRTAPAEALDIAHRHALSALIDKTEDAGLRRELGWTRDALDARRSPPAVTDSTLQSYAGQYGSRRITFDSGRLSYQRAADAGKMPLLPLSATEFALGEGQRLQFVVKGSSIELRLLQTDGTHVAYQRQPLM